MRFGGRWTEVSFGAAAFLFAFLSCGGRVAADGGGGFSGAVAIAEVRTSEQEIDIVGMVFAVNGRCV